MSVDIEHKLVFDVDFQPDAHMREAGLTAERTKMWVGDDGFAQVEVQDEAGVRRVSLTPDMIAQLRRDHFKEDAFDGYGPGDVVEKYTGDYQMKGVVRSRFTTERGKVRYVVEHAGGMLHIYSAANLRPISLQPGRLEAWDRRHKSDGIDVVCAQPDHVEVAHGGHGS